MSGASVNTKDNFYNTPLIAACKGDHSEVAKLLLQNNAPVDITFPVDLTALQVAVCHSNSEIVEMLLTARANISATNRSGSQALPMALNKHLWDMILILLRNSSYIPGILIRPSLNWKLSNMTIF